MVRLRPFRQSTVTGNEGAYSKLDKKFYGLFEIVERIGPVAYKLHLPEGARIHLIFHCSLLKPFHGAPGDDPQPLSPTSINNQPIITPLVIIDSRCLPDSSLPKWEVLVQWEGLSPDDTSWEDWDQLRAGYHLEDKVFPQVAGNVSNQGVQTKGSKPGVQIVRNRPRRINTIPSYLKDFI